MTVVLNKLYSRGLWGAVSLNIAVTLFHFVAWASAPFESNFPISNAWIVFIFFELVLITILFILIRFVPNQDFGFNNIEQSISIDLRLLCGLALIGLIFHLIAKSSVLEFSDLSCFSKLRSVWIQYDKTNDPLWRRLLSMMAYILCHLALPAVFITSFKLTQHIKNLRNWFYFALANLLIIGFALVIVSRMIILTASAVAMSGCFLSWMKSDLTIKKAFARFSIVILISISLISVSSLLIARDRIQCSGNDPISYNSSNLNDMKANWNSSKNLYEKCNACISILMYFNHGLFNVSQITSTEERGSKELLAFVNHYLMRLGVSEYFNYGESINSKSRVFSAGGLGLAGAAFHDYGWIGVFVLAIFLSVLWGFAIFCLQNKFFIIGFILLPCLFFTFLIQFMFVGPATISFPFMAFAFFGASFLPHEN